MGPDSVARRRANAVNRADVDAVSGGFRDGRREPGGRLMVVGGGLPVSVDGQVVGGIGVSSGTPDQDMVVAQAGIEAFLKQV